MLRPAIVATALAGALDIIFAMILTMALGNEIPAMLRFVASGPFPAATSMGLAGSALGLAVHFALMAIMVLCYLLAAARIPALLRRPVLAGIAYGLLTYLVMNWLVVPLRFDAPLPPKPLSIVTQLFAHIVLVGIPIALIAAKAFPVYQRSHQT